MKILMVCLGNICRSPLAEGILQHKATLAKLNWFIDSAGTGNYHIGEAPHTLSQKVAALNGIDISKQKARQFVATDMLHFDKIYVMDSENYQNVKKISGSLFDASKTNLLLNEVTPNQNKSVPDPWYDTEKAYHEVFAMISNACDAIINKYATQSI